jgi:hypothetical protein
LRDLHCQNCGHQHQNESCRQQIVYKYRESTWHNYDTVGYNFCGCNNTYSTFIYSCNHSLVEWNNYKRT